MEDYDPTGKRLPGGPKFDHRSGALSAFATRPFTEFAVLCEDGDTIDPVDVIEGQLERKRLQTVLGDEDNNGSVMPADRESKRFLGRRTLAEKLEALQCARMLQALQHDKPAFEEALAKAMVHQRGMALQMGLDQDEAEVAAVMSLLWDAGPRTYLNFLDRTNKRRIRNAWDRLDRRRKESGFRLKLRELARNGPRDEDPELVKSAATAKHDGTICEYRDMIERKERILRNQFIERFCDSLAATGVSAMTPSERSSKTHGLVDLEFDLARKERLSYVAASGKGPPSASHRRIYSE